MYDVELDVICEASSIIRKFSKDKEVLREQLHLIEKYAGIICAKAAEAGQQPATSHNTQSAAIAQIAARLDHRVKTDRQLDNEEAWQDVVAEAVRQLRAL